MDSTNSKRKLVCAEEKHFVLQMVLQHKDTVENKKTDGVTVEEKKRAWREITEAFNSVPEHNKKTVEQIKKIWDNEKTKRKKQLCEEKREQMRTGGGSSTKMSPQHDPDVDVILGQVDIELHFILDSDTFTVDKQDKGAPALMCQYEEPIIELVEEIENDVEDGIVGTPKVKSPTDPLRMAKRRREPPAVALKKKIIDKEMELRCLRLQTLMDQESELHHKRVAESNLRLKENRIRVREANLRVQEQRQKIQEQELRVQMQQQQLLLLKEKNCCDK